VKKQNGFTLVEVLVGLVIIALVVSVTVPRLGRSLGTQMKSVTRKIIAASREMHNNARIKNKTFRLVIELGDKEKHAGQQITVESADPNYLMPDPEEEKNKRSKTSDKEAKPASRFSPDIEVLRHPIILPDGVIFEDVEVKTESRPIVEGKAYVHYFPSGLVDLAVIHITNGKSMKWTLVIAPLTGAVNVRTEYVSLKDISP
jgi:general secretion pathway protein H